MIARHFVVLMAVLGVAPRLTAQSVTAGSVYGTVTDAEGLLLDGARVVLTQSTTGFESVVETGIDGRFVFGFLPPGDYELLVERLWSRPIRWVGIPVRPGRRYEVPVRLIEVPPPVEEVELHDFTNGGTGIDRPDLTRPGGSRWFSPVELKRIPDATRGIAELGRLSSVSGAGLYTEGLPGRFSGVVIDGIPFVGADHPDLVIPTIRGALFSRNILEHAELLTNGLDVEWSNFPAGALSGYTTRGSRRLKVRAFGDWSGQPLAQSARFSPENVGHSIVRAGVLVQGPVIPDTAEFAIGVEVRRVETPTPRLWRSPGLDSILLAVAADSFQVDLSRYLRPLRRDLDLASFFGRFDGRISEGFAVSVRANAATLRMETPELGLTQISGLGSSVEGNDVSAAVTLTSVATSSVGLEIRAGLEISNRDYGAGPVPATIFVEGPIALGTDPALPGQFERVGFRGSGVLHAQVDAHRLKFGTSASLASFDMTYEFGRSGTFLFGGMEQFARREGVFVQSVGTLPVARFQTSQFGGFVQDTWTLVPGFELTGGLRMDLEFLPNKEIRPNEDWQALTGVGGTSIESSRLKLSPRLGLVMGDPQRWQVRAEFGTYHGDADPAVLAEGIVRSGSAEVRRGVGTLGRWPATPDSVAAPVVGQSLTLLVPKYQAPRTYRASMGVTGAVGRDTDFYVSAVYRHTDFLIRRSDLNLVAAPIRRDQHGRPIFGILAQQGALLATVPGSNRRFAEFDMVSAMNLDGVSDYWGLTVEIKRRMGGWLSGALGYTYSVTEDNLVGDIGGGPTAQLNPFPLGLGGFDWAEGRSDFDVPHRVTAGVELDFPLGRFLPAVRLAGFYRFRSGLPFTPGFRGGVDVNGDGAFGNDPAFVDDRIPEVSELFSKWDCLRGQAGRFAARNACRGPGVHTLDARFAARVRFMGHPMQLVIDGVNLLDSGIPVLDQALFLVDRNGTATFDPATGRVSLPFVTNPTFGGTVARRTTGRRLRIGMRLGYE